MGEGRGLREHLERPTPQLLRGQYQGRYPKGDDDIGLSFSDSDTFPEMKWRKFSKHRGQLQRVRKKPAPAGNSNSEMFWRKERRCGRRSRWEPADGGSYGPGERLWALQAIGEAGGLGAGDSDDQMGLLRAYRANYLGGQGSELRPDCHSL